MKTKKQSRQVSSIIRKISMMILYCCVMMTVMFSGGNASGSVGERVRRIATDLLPNPPIALNVRSGVLSDWVLRVRNISTDKGIKVRVFFDKQQCATSLALMPGEIGEVGMLELNYGPRNGDRGTITVEGYSKKLYFELANDSKYRTWYGL